MENQNEKFYSLTPEVLDENKKIYTEALDFAFSNNDIKNIAITGIYGAGKSTVWNTYVEKNKLDNIITVSLGKYEDDLFVNHIKKDIEVKNLENSDIPENEKQEINKEETDINSNRIERQIINQILSQIKTENIPLSKYKFKENKGGFLIWLNVLPIISLLLAILIWLSKDIITALLMPQYIGIKSVIVLSLLLILYPAVYWSYTFIHSNSLRLSKINLKGAEADFNEKNHDDETILERDMKEIVYLLNSSDANVVVFEDLDRYDNIDIFTKLRELNFLLNSFLRVKDDKKKVVKFVYMLRDGIFFSKNRTKFFDFIVPIVPVVDSKNSENKLLESLNIAENIPDKRTISKISLYIDDMRLLKNIINEYLVYENIIAIDELELDPNKLFSLVVLKNIFPKEFELLQSDRGYIFNIFQNVEIYKQDICAKLEKQLEKVIDEKEFLNNRHENSKFEAMAAMIPPNIRVQDFEKDISWSDFLRRQSEKPNESFIINYVDSNSNISSTYYNYEDFLNKYIYKTSEIKEFIYSLPVDVKDRIIELSDERRKLEKTIRERRIGLVRDQLELLNSEEISDIFKITEDTITQSHYFPLIRALIVQGLIDETYWHYKGYFYNRSLGKNDTIFIKNLLEAKPQDIFLNIENPMEVIYRLDLSDYSKFNILNHKIFELSIEHKKCEEIFAMMESVHLNDNYGLLIQILETYDYKTIKKLINIILKNYTHIIVELLDKCATDKHILFKNILIAICTSTNVDKGTIILFKSYIEQNENIISLIADENFDIFIKNMLLADIEFENISESQANRDRIKKLESNKLFKLTIDNVKSILEIITNREVEYKKILDDIMYNEDLTSTKEYIDLHFIDFISMYIDEKNDNEVFSNNEDIVIKIINSELLDNYKQSYLMNNETRISDINKIEDLTKKEKLINILFEKNKVVFTISNINCYWNSMDSYNQVFVNYIDKNINENNYREILFGNDTICDSFINNNEISDKMFSYVLRCAKNKIENIDEKIPQYRIKILVEKDYISINNDNIRKMLENNYYEEIVLLINKQKEELEDEAILILLDLELSPKLIYQLVNSNISDENSKKLLDKIIADVDVKKISFDKTVAISYIIDNGLSEKNINYICKNFDSFKLKDKYIRYLDENRLFNNIKNENLTDSFIQMTFSKTDIYIDSKLDIIVNKIKGKASKDELAKLISSIEDISELSNVWNNKYPKLDNEYKERVGLALIDSDYVTKRKYKDCIGIMGRKNT